MDERRVVRIGDSERQAAVEALTAHREAGRLDSTEFEERQVAASRARTWVEIVPLFVDLPEPHPTGMPVGLSAAPSSAPAPRVSQPVVRRSAELAQAGALDNLVPPRYRGAVMALTPLAAVVLFFLTRQWVSFLTIPIMAILLYGPDDDKKRRRSR